MVVLKRALSRFVTWWLGELACLFPAVLRQWWRESGNIVVLSLGTQRGALLRPGKERLEEVLSFDLDQPDPSMLRNDLARRAPQLLGKNSEILLALPAERILRRTVILPLAVEENLRQTLMFELDRYTPFRPDQVYFDFRVRTRDTARRRLTVELAVAQKALIDHEVARATALGLPVAGAVLAEDVQGGGDFMDFLSASAKTGGRPVRRWWRLGLAATAGLLLAVLLATPVWQKRAAAISLLEPMTIAKAEALKTDALRDRLTKATDEYNFLLDKKRGSYSTLQVLEEVSRLLPDDTFLMQFDFDGKTVQLQGESASSSRLVEILDASPLLAEVAFRAQLVKIQGTAYDRFHIGATLEREEKPPTRDSYPAPTIAKDRPPTITVDTASSSRPQPAAGTRQAGKP